MVDKAFDSFESSLKKPEVSMTPLIDMVFLLLIFFVVTTTFTKETGIKVEKAKAVTSTFIQKKLLLVSIDKEGNYWYDEKQHSSEEILDIVKERVSADDETNVVIIPDKNGRVEPLITIMDLLRTHDITRFSLGTQQDYGAGSN
ncbi:MAG: ExbD/TolR family protein [Chitinispirillaceae bacterium]